MKKFLLSVLCVAAAMTTQSVNAQTFTTQYDTASAVWNGTALQINNPISTSSVNDSVIIRWWVVGTGTDFPSDWYSNSGFGICDNYNCYGTLSNIWNGSTGATFTSHEYKGAGAPANFHMLLDLSAAASPNGLHYMTVHLEDAANSSNSKNIVFKINVNRTGVNSVAKADDNIVLYPNPATSDVNITYNTQTNISTISVYNLIGKVVRVYKPTDNSGARLNIDNIPSGIYFVRLQDAQGNIVATRKFTRE